MEHIDYRKKYDIKRIENIKKLKKDDIIILARHETYGYGDHYFTLGKVSKTSKEIIVDSISCNYGTKDLDNFLNSVELTSFVYSSVDVLKEHCYISVISKQFLIDKYDEQIKSINSAIKKLKDEKEKFIKFYSNDIN